jgi:hypothetical protein
MKHFRGLESRGEIRRCMADKTLIFREFSIAGNKPLSVEEA